MNRLLHLEQEDSVRWSLDLAKIYGIDWTAVDLVDGVAWEGRVYTIENKESHSFAMTFTLEGKNKLVAAWDELVEQRNRIYTWTYTTETDEEGNQSFYEEVQVDLSKVSALRWKASTLPGMDWLCEIYTYDNFEAFMSVECLEGEKDEFQEAYHIYGLVQ